MCWLCKVRLPSSPGGACFINTVGPVCALEFLQVLQYMQLPPEAADLTDRLIKGAAAPHTLLPAGHAISEPAPLIAEISAALEAELRDRYRGSQAERAAAEASTSTPGTAF